MITSSHWEWTALPKHSTVFAGTQPHENNQTSTSYSNALISQLEMHADLISVSYSHFALLRWNEGPFSSQKFSPKNFHLSFKYMYEVLNIIK